MNAAKFLPPRPMHILDRERLMNRLLLHEDKKLVIVHAQAGQGKSVLASEYARSLSTPFLWYNMDREDDNPAVFLSSLAHALHGALPGHGDRIPGLAQNITAAAARNGLLAPSAACLLADITAPLLIVFDDLNSTSALPPLMQMLALLIETSPGPVRFMIISRSRPALELSGLRAKREVAEITGNDLRFSDSEAYELFSSVFGMQLPLPEAARINRSAEGWPAALVLMEEYLASGAGSAAEGHALNRLRAPVFEYLAHEIFSRLPGDMQRFLLRTSVPEYLPVPLASRLVYPHARGDAPVSAMIEQLLARNMFVTALNEERSVIRYHALFRDFLREKLRAGTRASGVAKLHSTAAAYFTHAGNPAAAIDLLVASGQQHRAIREIERCAPELIARGQAGSLLRWRQSLPPDMRERPWFLLSRALASRFTDPRSALVLFERAYRRFSAPGSPHRISGRMQSLCGLIEACFHSGGDFKRMARAAAAAQRLIARSGGQPPARARLLLAVGMAWFFLGRLERSRSALARALELFTLLRDRFYQITCALYLTPCALYQGDFRLAREVVRKGFDAQASMPEETASRAALFLIKAMTALFEGNFTEAGQCIEECKGLSDEHALESIGFLCTDIGGWIRIAQGDYRGAERMLAEGKRRGQEAGNKFFSASAAHLLAIAYLFQNRLAKARAESDCALRLHPSSGGSLFRAIYLIAGGVIHLKSGRLRQAEQELLGAAAELRRLRAAQQEANAHLALAMLYERKNGQREFRNHLRQAFSIGQERGFSYYALLTSKELVDLARTAVALGICTEYAESLIEGAAFAPRFRVRCLGGFTVHHEGRKITDAEWKSPRAKELFKLLAGHDRGKLPREQIMDALWQREMPRDPRGSFNAMLCRLRKTLDASAPGGSDIFCIEREGDVIALNHRVVWTDVRQFQAHLARAGRLKSGNRSAEQLEEYQRAIDLYQGDFLPEETHAGWTAEVRDRLRDSYLQALAAAAEAAEADGGAARAQQFYEKMFSADPCSEKACRWLMVRYASAGHRREAVRTYEQCERALSRDMDLEPEEKTKKVYRSIIGG